MSTINVKLSRGDNTPWGFRLQGGKDFGSPIAIQRVNPNSLAEQGGLQSGDTILFINNNNADLLRHKEAQDVILRAGNSLELKVERGGTRIWKPTVTPVGDIKQQAPGPLTKTSLAANKQDFRPVGSSHNVPPKPFSSVPSVVNMQYNSPVNLYSMQSIAEALTAQTEVLATGAKGINFMKEDKPINKGSAVYQMVHQADETGQKEPTPIIPPSIKHVPAPMPKPAAPKPAESNQSLCADCGRLIVGVFVRIKDKSLHAECFKCSTCGTSLKNVGYYNVNDKLYCDIHAKQAATMTGAPAHVEPITVGPGQSLPFNTPILSVGVPPPQAPASVPMASPKSPGISNISPMPFHRPAGEIHHVAAPISPQPLATSCPPSFPPAPPPVLPPAPVLAPATCPVVAPVPPAPLPTSTKAPAPAFEPALTFAPVANAQCPGPLENLQQPLTTNGFHDLPEPVKAPAPMSPPTAPHVPGSFGHPKTAPPSDVHRQIQAPRRGRGQLKQQAGPGTRIPICSDCGSPIRGPFIVALGKTWCPDHFLCKNNQCRRPLQDIGFVEEQGQLYCEICWEAYLAPTCCKCSSRIKGDCLNALDKQWHPECFVCAYCRKPFGNSSFYLEDGQPYCEKDWNEMFTTKCVGCGFPIEAGDRWVEALNNNYHSQCFKCTICHKNLEGQSFYAKGGRPFCKAHAR